MICLSQSAAQHQIVDWSAGFSELRGEALPPPFLLFLILNTVICLQSLSMNEVEKQKDQHSKLYLTHPFGGTLLSSVERQGTPGSCRASTVASLANPHAVSTMAREEARPQAQSSSLDEGSQMAPCCARSRSLSFLPLHRCSVGRSTHTK